MVAAPRVTTQCRAAVRLQGFPARAAANPHSVKSVASPEEPPPPPSDDERRSTVTDFEVEPPAPLQVSVNVLATVSGAVDWVPEVGFAPDHEPEATQLAASVEVQVRVVVAPELTAVGSAVSVTVGAGGVLAICSPYSPNWEASLTRVITFR